MLTPPKTTSVAQTQILAVAADAFVDLRGEFARRHENQRARRFRRMRPAACKRCRMGSVNPAVLPVPVCAPASMSRPARISGITRDLNGSGLGVLTIRERTDEFGHEPERGKWHKQIFLYQPTALITAQVQ